MQEKKNKRLAILLFALCCVTVIVFYLGRDGTVEVDKNIFKDYDLKSIDQIVLESRKGRVDLKFNGTKWEVNNQFDADASLIEVLFATLQQAEPKRPLAASVQDSVSNELKKNGVKVSLHSAGKTESIFYAGGNTQKTQAFFYADGDDSKPYLVTIPGYRVYVSGIFELPEKDWKNKFVFGFNWRNFQRLEATFPQKPSDNFEVAFDDNYFSVQGLAAVDTTRLNDYLDDVSLLTVDEYIDNNVFPDSLSKPSPVLILTVKDIGQRVYSLEIYSPSKKGELAPGLINRVQWAFFDPRKFQNIIKTRSFFEK